MEYNGKQYPERTVDIPDYGSDLVISTESLQDALFPHREENDWEAESDTARCLDEEVFFYVDDEDIILPKRELINLIIRNL